MKMNEDDQPRITDVVVKCKNCGKFTVQSAVIENNGNCPNCNKKFQMQVKLAEWVVPLSGAGHTCLAPDRVMIVLLGA